MPNLWVVVHKLQWHLHCCFSLQNSPANSTCSQPSHTSSIFMVWGCILWGPLLLPALSSIFLSSHCLIIPVLLLFLSFLTPVKPKKRATVIFSPLVNSNSRMTVRLVVVFLWINSIIFLIFLRWETVVIFFKDQFQRFILLEKPQMTKSYWGRKAKQNHRNFCEPDNPVFLDAHVV